MECNRFDVAAVRHSGGSNQFACFVNSIQFDYRDLGDYYTRHANGLAPLDEKT